MVNVFLAIWVFGLVPGRFGIGPGVGRPIAPLDKAQADQQRAEAGSAGGNSHVCPLGSGTQVHVHVVWRREGETGCSLAQRIFGAFNHWSGLTWLPCRFP
ncbi:hypothetical protein DPEC_G00064490 [Dallia pectoralis]|uniref:Uncharacterized protein n=1 Tax=Dallia pectoralis TaxID=75939 RepID=A0ACC2H834_DALPE|nr:hypothetical protein DPEC_G00064490 [Dallia pectoralis]